MGNDRSFRKPQGKPHGGNKITDVFRKNLDFTRDCRFDDELIGDIWFGRVMVELRIVSVEAASSHKVIISEVVFRGNLLEFTDLLTADTPRTSRHLLEKF